MKTGSELPLYMVICLNDENFFNACIAYSKEEITEDQLSAAYPSGQVGKPYYSAPIVGCLEDDGTKLAFLSSVENFIWNQNERPVYLLVYAASWDEANQIACANPVFRWKRDTRPQETAILWSPLKFGGCVDNCQGRLLWSEAFTGRFPPLSDTDANDCLQSYLQDVMVKDSKKTAYLCIVINERAAYETCLDYEARLITQDELVRRLGGNVSFYQDTPVVGALGEQLGEDDTLVGLCPTMHSIDGGERERYLLLYGTHYDSVRMEVCANPYFTFKRPGGTAWFWPTRVSTSIPVSDVPIDEEPEEPPFGE